MTIHLLRLFILSLNTHSFILCSVLPEEMDPKQQEEKTLNPTNKCVTQVQKKAQNDSVMKKQETSTALKEDSVSAPLKV